MSDYTPKPEHKFTFGLWTVGNPGTDAFGQPARLQLSPADLVYLPRPRMRWMPSSAFARP
jgi:xylose isomerase